MILSLLVDGTVIGAGVVLVPLARFLNGIYRKYPFEVEVQRGGQYRCAILHVVSADNSREYCTLPKSVVPSFSLPPEGRSKRSG